LVSDASYQAFRDASAFSKAQARSGQPLTSYHSEGLLEQWKRVNILLYDDCKVELHMESSQQLSLAERTYFSEGDTDELRKTAASAIEKAIGNFGTGMQGLSHFERRASETQYQSGAEADNDVQPGDVPE
jgi:hypothetical protein